MDPLVAPRGFSRASRTTSCCASSEIGGRPLEVVGQVQRRALAPGPAQRRLGPHQKHRPARPWEQPAQRRKQRPVGGLRRGRGCWRRSTASSWRNTRISISLASAEQSRARSAQGHGALPSRGTTRPQPPSTKAASDGASALRQAIPAGHRPDRLLAPHGPRYALPAGGSGAARRVAAERPWEVPTRAVTVPAPAWDSHPDGARDRQHPAAGVQQRADLASCLRPAAGLRARRPGSRPCRREGGPAPGRPCDPAP